LSLYLPIIYGSISHPLPASGTGEYATHKWRLYVRSPDYSEGNKVGKGGTGGVRTSGLNIPEGEREEDGGIERSEGWSEVTAKEIYDSKLVIRNIQLVATLLALTYTTPPL